MTPAIFTMPTIDDINPILEQMYQELMFTYDKELLDTFGLELNKQNLEKVHALLKKIVQATEIKIEQKLQAKIPLEDDE